jgi:hypothetical protein
VPHGIRDADDAVGRRGGALAAAEPDLPARRGREGVRSSAARRSSRPTRTSRITSSSTSTFHGENGAGIGASHQTGWTGLVAKLIQQSGQ